ncbi:MAG: YceI family protein [Candidatus Polarisedimenticolia bacterium]
MTHSRLPLGTGVRALAGAVLAGAALAAAAGPAPAFAAPETYAIDVNHSSVGFKIRHFASRVPGRFNVFEGTIVVDRQDLAKSRVEVTIDAASIDTANADRDAHLKSADFFDVATHPKIVFRSTRVSPSGEGKARIEGDLAIRGTTRPVVLEVEMLGFGPGPGGKTVGGFEAKTRINRQDFKVAWNRAVEGAGLVLGDDVDIVINVEAGKAGPPPAAPAAAKPGR